jgi:hypothetical protein
MPCSCSGAETAEMSRRISFSRARRTGSPMARAASYEAWAGLTTKSVRLINSIDRMIETIRVGVMVKMLHTSTSRMCRREPAAPRRRSSQSWVSRTASTTTSAMAMTRSATSSPVIQPVVTNAAGTRPVSQA